MFLIFYIFLLQPLNTFALRLGECQALPLGMESGEITNMQITASTSFDRQSVGPQNARLRHEMDSGAWCPKPQIDSNSYEFLQINLDRTHIVSAIQTQGRFGNGTGREFTKEYMIDYLRPGSKWIRYTNRTGHVLMTGNFDTVTAVMRQLDPPIIASRIRIVPHSKTKRTICMRAELHGCLHRDGLLYYSTVPEGSRMGDYDFRDPIFEDNQLFTETGIKRGLGLLSDGYVADSSPFTPSNHNASWIGWNKHQTGGTITLLFEFDQIRNFSEILLALHGHRLDSIDVIFSQDGTNFPLSSQISSLDRLAANSTAKRYDLRIPLHRRMARKVRVTIKFPGDWLFLTEIHFASVLSNETNASFDNPIEGFIKVDRNLMSIIGLCVLFVIFILVIFGILCVRKRKNPEKEDMFQQDVKRDLIITHMGGKQTTHIFPSAFSSQYNTNLYATDKTTSTSVSTKSTSSIGKTTPPTWNDFHFPPPPEERIYAEPCMTLPLLPSKRRPQTDLRSSMTTRRPKHIDYSDEVQHYATGNLFSDMYGFDKIERYHFNSLKFGADLGEGKLTRIKECFLPVNKQPAVYKCAKDKNNLHARKAILDELKTLSITAHPHIVRLLGTDENASLLLELMPLGDVKQYLKNLAQPLPLSSILSICADVCSGMAYLESKALVHGHLTPSHILLSDTLRAKISSPRGPSHPAQLRYSAPESIINNKFSSKSDSWAYAVCCYEILYQCQKVPYENLTNAELVENAERVLEGNENETVILRIPEAVPRGIREIISRCFDAHPPGRPTFGQIYTFIDRFHS
ncbi:unnamed protein product [Auanema sp. JU1783]|nr:unnamed protein product [Auanema sp. JU1783]